MDSANHMMLGAALIVILLALLLVMMRSRRRRRTMKSARPIPVNIALIVYAIGVVGLAGVTYGPQYGLAEHELLQNAVLFLFMLATSILILALLSRKRA